VKQTRRVAKVSVGPEGRTERSKSHEGPPHAWCPRKRVSARRAERSAQKATKALPTRRTHESECRPGGPNGALKKPRRPSPRVVPTKASVGPEGRTERSPRVVPTKASVGPEGRTERSKSHGALPTRGTHESECRPGGPNGALKKPRSAPHASYPRKRVSARRAERSDQKATERSPRVVPTKASVGPEGRTERSNNAPHAAFARALPASSTRRSKVTGSWMAISESILRLSRMPACWIAFMNWL